MQIEQQDFSTKKSFFDKLVDVIAWLQIVASPLLAGLILGFIAYLFLQGVIGIVIGSLITIAFLVIGINWANRVWKREGAMTFMSRIIAMPELQKKEIAKK